MCLKILLSILYFVFAASFCVGDYPKCGSSFLIRDGPFDTSRRTILSTLGSEVSSREGYYNGSVGNGPGRIYALGWCIPGIEPKRCSDCIQVVSNDLLKSCLNETVAYEYGTENTLCLVRYSDSFFFDVLNQQPIVRLCNIEDIGNATEFNSIWKDFMEDMIVSASSMKYAAKVSPPMGFQRIYALMMCIPGLSSTDCEVCLQRSVTMYQTRCEGRQGFNVRRPPCYFKWETFPFYNAFADQTVLNPLNPQGPQPTASFRPPDGKSISTRIAVAILVSTFMFGTLLALGVVFLKRRLSYRRLNLETNEDIASPQSLQFDFKMVEAATDSFSENNKIGQGGFGAVYMGILPNGTEVAVKRLSKNSGQGMQEFKNEVICVAKLQHRNLVSLLGFCLEGDEQILIYEFVPNKSLDYFLFGPIEQRHLDWRRRYNIIGGIARGILYLHQDSRSTIIHRDLKASNILLDGDMNPKIADFGMARIFGMEQSRATTNKIAGTFGYMAPEYAMRGQFSMKSDVYSFGVLVLEILSGKINSSFNETDGCAGNLVTHAWRLWRKGLPLQLLDPIIRENYQSDEVTRCIHIALLCVQEDPQDRPFMSTIILLLTSTTITLEVPRAPGFFLQSSRDRESDPEGLNSRDSNLRGLNSRDSEVESSNSVGNLVSCSIDEATITELDPR